jgi:hypothetical protein
MPASASARLAVRVLSQKNIRQVHPPFYAKFLGITLPARETRDELALPRVYIDWLSPPPPLFSKNFRLGRHEYSMVSASVPEVNPRNRNVRYSTLCKET